MYRVNRVRVGSVEFYPTHYLSTFFIHIIHIAAIIVLLPPCPHHCRLTTYAPPLHPSLPPVYTPSVLTCLRPYACLTSCPCFSFSALTMHASPVSTYVCPNSHMPLLADLYPAPLSVHVQSAAYACPCSLISTPLHCRSRPAGCLCPCLLAHA